MNVQPFLSSNTSGFPGFKERHFKLETSGFSIVQHGFTLLKAATFISHSQSCMRVEIEFPVPLLYQLSPFLAYSF